MTSTRVPGGRWMRAAAAFFGLVCVSRAVAYSSVLGPPHESPGPMILTDGGRYLPFFAALWAVIGLSLLIGSVLGRISSALVAMGVMMIVWGGTYVGAWVLSRFHAPDLITAALYVFIGSAEVCLGMAVVVIEARFQALRSRIAQLEVHEVITGPHPTTGGSHAADRR